MSGKSLGEMPEEKLIDPSSHHKHMGIYLMGKNSAA